MTITDEREKLSMERHARLNRDSLDEMVRLYGLLGSARDSDDIEPDDWSALNSEFDIDPECETCGVRYSEHPARLVDATPADDLSLYVALMDAEDPDDICDEFTCATDDLQEEAQERIQERNYGAGVKIVVDVTLYGGGPAGGIEFECEKGRYGLVMLSAQVWHQDWFQPKGYAVLDDDTAEPLFQLWGLEYMMGD